MPEELITLKHVYNHEFDTTLGVNYLGRADFGEGSIDATEVEPIEFLEQLEYIGTQGLVYASDMSQLNGGCMDGRGNLMTITGKPVAPRPKVIGGNSLFGWNVAAVGNFSILEGIKDPVEQFVVVNEALQAAGFRLGMHEICGAALGVEPVLENYASMFGQIRDLGGSRSREILDSGDLVNSSDILEGIEKTIDQVQLSTNFSESTMHKIVRQLDGDDSIIKLVVDDDHYTKGHEEIGLLLLRVNNAVAYKDKVIKETGKQVFIQNAVYGMRIVDALARTEVEHAKGIVICDQLPIAGIATLGNGQHVGEISGSLSPSAG